MCEANQPRSGPAIIDIAGTELTLEDKELLCHSSVAGVILFSRNTVSAQQVADLCRAISAVRSDLLICIDQEGGRVQRLKQGVTRIPAMSELGQLYTDNRQQGLEFAQSVGWLMARELRALGIHLSFAPVLDLDADFCPAIGDRSFGRDVDQVTDLSKAFITGMKQAGMGAVGKHFPGHGNVSTDSHIGLPVDCRSLQEIAEFDMVPFERLSQNYLQGIMPAHIVFDQVDSSTVGFSSVWLKEILRQKLQYNGLIFSDDLSMAAAESGGDFIARSKAALSAGCDLLLLCNNRAAAIEVIESLKGRLLSAQALKLKQSLIGGRPKPFTKEEQIKQQAIRQSLSRLV